MKRYLLHLFCLALCTGMVYGQSIVDTTHQKKKVLLEQFGGMYCGYCPEANDIADQLKADHPEDCFIINIQTGYFAQPIGDDPDMRTSWGPALDLLAGNGQIYPAGTVNRHVFSGHELLDIGTTALGRNQWNYAANQILNESSPVNIAAQANFDPATNSVNIYTEIYYTADYEADVNRLNLALIQHNVIAPQLLENETMDLNYNHNYLLRDLITNQWGESIDTTTYGHFESRLQSYSVPATYRGIPVALDQLEVVAFITVNQQEVLTATAAPVIVQPSPYLTEVNLWEANVEVDICDHNVSPSVIVRNDGSQNITNLTFEYVINNGDIHHYEWSGNIHSMEVVEIELPSVYFQQEGFGNNTLQVTVLDPNGVTDENEINNTAEAAFEDIPVAFSPTVQLQLRTDDFGHEVYWEVRDKDGNLIISGGNQNVGSNGGGLQLSSPGDPGAYGNNQLITKTIELPGYECFEFRILDDFADGICCKFGQGFYRILDANGQELLSGGKFGKEFIDPFLVDAFATTASMEQPETENIRIYPNPVRANHLNVEFTLDQKKEALEIKLINPKGQLVEKVVKYDLSPGLNHLQIPLPSLPAGIYFLKLEINDVLISKKVIIP